MLGIKHLKNQGSSHTCLFAHLSACRILLSQRHTWQFYTPIAENLIASENRLRFSPPIDADTPGDFFCRSRRCGSFENSCDKISQPDGLALMAIRSNKRRKSRERAHLANAGEFNRRYRTCQISAILYADRSDRRKSQSLHRTHLAILKSLSVSLALGRSYQESVPMPSYKLVRSNWLYG